VRQDRMSGGKKRRELEEEGEEDRKEIEKEVR
jgi:hypothetical protein